MTFLLYIRTADGLRRIVCDETMIGPHMRRWQVLAVCVVPSVRVAA